MYLDGRDRYRERKYVLAIILLMSTSTSAETSLEHDHCRPKGCRTLTYIYQLPPPCSNWNATSPRAFSEAFGPRDSREASHWRHTGNRALSALWHFRVQHSSCRTLCAHAADLFFVPALTLGGLRLGGLREIKRSCGDCSAEELERHLIHLDESTAAKHVLICPIEHFALAPCIGWWSHPRGLFSRMIRLSFSAVAPASMASHLEYMVDKQSAADLMDIKAFPNLYSLPQPSNVHWGQDPPFNVSRKRPRLMSFVGSITHGDVEVRRRIAQQCVALRSLCTWIHIGFGGLTKSLNLVAKVKLDTIFCLEPAGDTPYRRSIADSVAVGCIPVYFNNVTDLTGGLLWGPWHNDSRVLLSRDAFLAGRIHIKELTEISPATVAKMQNLLWSHAARAFQISDWDDPKDSVGLMLEMLATRVRVATQLP